MTIGQTLDKLFLGLLPVEGGPKPGGPGSTVLGILPLNADSESLVGKLGEALSGEESAAGKPEDATNRTVADEFIVSKEGGTKALVQYIQSKGLDISPNAHWGLVSLRDFGEMVAENNGIDAAKVQEILEAFVRTELYDNKAGVGLTQALISDAFTVPEADASAEANTEGSPKAAIQLAKTHLNAGRWVKLASMIEGAPEDPKDRAGQAKFFSEFFGIQVPAGEDPSKVFASVQFTVGGVTQAEEDPKISTMSVAVTYSAGGTERTSERDLVVQKGSDPKWQFLESRALSTTAETSEPPQTDLEKSISFAQSWQFAPNETKAAEYAHHVGVLVDAGKDTDAERAHGDMFRSALEGLTNLVQNGDATNAVEFLWDVHAIDGETPDYPVQTLASWEVEPADGKVAKYRAGTLARLFLQRLDPEEQSRLVDQIAATFLERDVDQQIQFIYAFGVGNRTANEPPLVEILKDGPFSGIPTRGSAQLALALLVRSGRPDTGTHTFLGEAKEDNRSLLMDHVNAYATANPNDGQQMLAVLERLESEKS